MSNFEVREVKTREELDTVIAVIWAAFETPYRREYQFLHPVYGYTDADYRQSVKKDQDREWTNHENNSESHWVYVWDKDTKEVAGGVRWNFHKESPFKNGPLELECTWFPESETRNFTTELLNVLMGLRMNWMKRPFFDLNRMGVHPKYRRRGVGKLLAEWGLPKADEMQLEGFLEASVAGRWLYEKYGFRSIIHFSADMEKRSPSAEWKRCQAMLGTTGYYAMWRPVRGKVEDGRNAPWEN